MHAEASPTRPRFQHVRARIVLPSFVLATMVDAGADPDEPWNLRSHLYGSLVLLHVPIEAALTATLLLRGWTTWLPMLPGLLLVRREMHRQQSMLLALRKARVDSLPSSLGARIRPD